MLFFCLCCKVFAQTNVATKIILQKNITAKRTAEKIKIDGLLTETAWKGAPIAKNFTELRPSPFRKEEEANRTEAYILYSDEGLYLAGYCYEKSKDSISTELRGRDGFGNNDWIGFVFDTYNDKLNGFEYFTTPLGEQMDAKVAPNQNGNNEDFSWNAVWESSAKIHADGWSFEMFIPFSAIRFSKKNIQDWGINIFRRRQKTGQQVFWSPLDPNVNGFLTQSGLLSNLENIKPPVRLQFSPYFSTYGNHNPYSIDTDDKWTSSINGGLDVKYGISQALTLDMTLIPDFGQVRNDNVVLNLGPFEQRFSENRAFFTEGTDLFNKGNLFYSRRVGERPKNYWNVYNNLDAGDKVISNPQTTKLANATKISGRLQGGLGVGFFNAIANQTFAVVEDANKTRRKVETSPLTNYNIIVLDQTLKNNSSVSLINTNVLRNGSEYDANVTAALFDFNDKKNTWNVGGKASTSKLFNYRGDRKNITGYTGSLYFGKTSGRFNFNFSNTITDANYNVRDLGYFTITNFMEHNLWLGYNWRKPTNWFNQLRINLSSSYSRRLKPNVYQSANFNLSLNGQLKNLWWTGFFAGYEPSGNNFYEPQTNQFENKFFKTWKSIYANFWFETNNAKKYQFRPQIFYVDRSFFAGHKLELSMSHRYRFSDKFSASYGLNWEEQINNAGYAAAGPVFGRRDIKTIQNSISLKYNFNNKMGVTSDIRHYWSEVEYKEFFDLLDDGTLQKNNSFSNNVNQNYNTFNMETAFTWQFAPGSFAYVVWKNFNDNDHTFDRIIGQGYTKNLNNTLGLGHVNNISLKIVYFLDFLQIRNLKKKKTL